MSTGECSLRWWLAALALCLAGGCGKDVTVGEDCYHGVCSDCSAETCEDGCCADGRCRSPSPSACGVAGASCLDCGQVGDSCSAAGECTCGGIPCASGEVCVDGQCRCGPREGCGPLGQCVDGQCRCGDGPACTPGQRCDNGLCVCDALSCSGCCWGDVTCQRDPSPDACGVEGQPCEVCVDGEECIGGGCRCGDGERCSPGHADACSPDEGCRCGDGPACEDGSACEHGACRCSPDTCSRGCCQDGVCHDPSLETCGRAGRPCMDCSVSGDSCTPMGDCLCGSSPACPPMLTCEDGACR